MLPNSMDSSTTNKPLEVMDRDHKIYTLRLSNYMVWESVGTSPSSLRTTKATLNNVSGYNIFGLSILPLG